MPPSPFDLHWPLYRHDAAGEVGPISLCQPTRKPTCVLFEHRRSESAACIETYVVFFRWLIGGCHLHWLHQLRASQGCYAYPEMRLQDLENRGLSSGGDASASHCGSVWLSARSSWNCSWSLEASARPSVCSRRKSSSTAHAFAAWWPGRLPCHIVTQWACYVKTICLVIVYIFVGHVRCFAVPRHIFSKTERYDIMNRQIAVIQKNNQHLKRFGSTIRCSSCHTCSSAITGRCSSCHTCCSAITGRCSSCQCHTLWDHMFAPVLTVLVPHSWCGLPPPRWSPQTPAPPAAPPLSVCASKLHSVFVSKSNTAGLSQSSFVALLVWVFHHAAPQGQGR